MSNMCTLRAFGALVWYKNLAFFLGAELVDGLLFKGNYRVWPLQQFEDGVFQEFVTRTIAVPNFPGVKRLEPDTDKHVNEELALKYGPSLGEAEKHGDLDPPNLPGTARWLAFLRLTGGACCVASTVRANSVWLK